MVELITEYSILYEDGSEDCPIFLSGEAKEEEIIEKLKKLDPEDDSGLQGLFIGMNAMVKCRPEKYVEFAAKIMGSVLQLLDDKDNVTIERASISPYVFSEGDTKAALLFYLDATTDEFHNVADVRFVWK